MRRICLVSCASSKLNRKAPSGDIYISPLFQFAKAVAQSEFDSWFILSAKHGLLNPREIIEPYNETLNEKNPKERQEWSIKVWKQLSKKLAPGDEITFLAGDAYREFLIDKLNAAGYSYKLPLQGLGLGQQIHALKLWSTRKQRLADLDCFYRLLAKLRNAQGQTSLNVCGGRAMASRGVYFFFELNEARLFDKSTLRCVRVGTHAVSKNSSSTLWNRLRTHRGTEAQSGNHRSSIFRLHVGAALLARGDHEKSVSWGIGQDAPPEIRNAEKTIEEMVSRVIGGMQVLWLAIGDEPGPVSDRSFIEKNSIGLLSGPEGPFDIPSRSWLGLHSPHAAIRRSGLWNVNYVDYEYDPSFLKVLDYYVDVTLGIKEPPLNSIAPKDWHKRIDDPQLPLI